MKKLQTNSFIILGLSFAFMVLLSSCATSVKTTSCPSFKNKQTNKAKFAKLELFKKNKRKAQTKSAALVKTEKQITVEAITRLNKLNTATLTTNTLADQLQPVQSIAATKIVDNSTLLSQIQVVKNSIQPNYIANELVPSETASINNEAVLANIEKENIVAPVLVESLTKKTKKELRKEFKQELKKQRKLHKKESNAPGGKSQLVALILAIFIGGLGIHRFYLGYTGIGIAQILTLGGLGIWTLIDIIRIAIGDLEPKDGPYDETL